jgi:hypothetical protein
VGTALAGGDSTLIADSASGGFFLQVQLLMVASTLGLLFADCDIFLRNGRDMSNYVNSVDRAIKLLKTSSHYSDYISIKIVPDHSGCCCLNHWSTTWQIIDEYIHPDGPIRSGGIRNEGDALIHQNDAQFVLECHETGPEIVIYLGAIAITAGLIKSVADLIAVILNARLEDSHVFKYKLKTFGNGGVIIQEEEIELKTPPAAYTTHQLVDYVQNSIVAGVHANIVILMERMDSDLGRDDYAGVLHCSASIFETMAKDIVGIPTVQNQTLKSFFDRYRKDSALPEGILDYIISIYEERNIMPLAGHGSTQTPTISKQEATALAEITKAFVNIEYKLQRAS